jgi:hypothetical protein
MSNAYRRFEKTLVASTPAVVLTVPAATTAIIRSIWVANNDADSADLTLTFSPEGAGTHVLVPAEAVVSKEYVDILARNNGGPLILEAADELTVSSTKSNVFVVVSALLVDRS